MNTLRFLAILALSTSMLSCSSGSDERAAPGAGPKNVAPAGEKAAAPIKLEKPTNSGPGSLFAEHCLLYWLARHCVLSSSRPSPVPPIESSAV